MCYISFTIHTGNKNFHTTLVDSKLEEYRNLPRQSKRSFNYQIVSDWKYIYKGRFLHYEQRQGPGGSWKVMSNAQAVKHVSERFKYLCKKRKAKIKTLSLEGNNKINEQECHQRASVATNTSQVDATQPAFCHAHGIYQYQSNYQLQAIVADSIKTPLPIDCGREIKSDTVGCEEFPTEVAASDDDWLSTLDYDGCDLMTESIQTLPRSSNSSIITNNNSSAAGLLASSPLMMMSSSFGENKSFGSSLDGGVLTLEQLLNIPTNQPPYNDDGPNNDDDSSTPPSTIFVPAASQA